MPGRDVVEYLTSDAKGHGLGLVARVGLGEHDGVDLGEVGLEHRLGSLTVGLLVDDGADAQLPIELVARVLESLDHGEYGGEARLHVAAAEADEVVPPPNWLEGSVSQPSTTGTVSVWPLKLSLLPGLFPMRRA